MKQYTPVLFQGHLDNFNSKLVIFESCHCYTVAGVLIYNFEG